jgi:hypothetical protein
MTAIYTARIRISFSTENIGYRRLGARAIAPRNAESQSPDQPHTIRP